MSEEGIGPLKHQPILGSELPRQKMLSRPQRLRRALGFRRLNVIRRRLVFHHSSVFSCVSGRTVHKHTQIWNEPDGIAVGTTRGVPGRGTRFFLLFIHLFFAGRLALIGPPIFLAVFWGRMGPVLDQVTRSRRRNCVVASVLSIPVVVVVILRGVRELWVRRERVLKSLQVPVGNVSWAVEARDRALCVSL
jgi:hypothetical protein